MIEGKTDLAYTVAIEILPPIELADFKGIKLERLIAEVTDAEVDEALAKHRRAEPAVRRQGRGRQGRERRPRHHRLHRQDRRRAVRGRHRRRRRAASRLGHLHPGLRGAADRRRGGRAAHRQRDVPADLSGRASGRQERRVRRHRQVDRSAAAGHDRRRIRQVARPGIARQARARWSRSGIAREHAGMSRQKVKRQLLDELDAKHKFEPPPTLVEDEFDNVWKTDRRRPAVAQAHLRRRGHDRGEGQGRIPRHRRAARAARPRARRDRRAQQHQGDRRGTEPRA